MNGNIIHVWYRRYGRMILESLPLCLLFTFLNPALIILQDPTYPMNLQAWLYLITLGILLSFAVGLLLSLIPERWKKNVILILRGFFFTFFLITIFYPYGGSLQDGSHELYPAWSELLPIFAVYTLLFVLLLWFKHRYYNALQRIYIFSVLIGLAIASYGAYNAITRFAAFTPLNESVDLTFAKNQNIIVILADMLQGTTVEQALSQHPGLKNTFSGFTFYTRAVSPFPFTNYALPALLTGKTYAGDSKKPLNFSDNLVLAQLDSFITDAHKKGFNSVIVGALVPAVDGAISLLPQSKSFQFAFICDQIDLGIVRIFKRRILGGELFNAPLTNYCFALKSASHQFLKKLTGATVGSASQKLFVFHNYMTHSPVGSFEEEGEPHAITAPLDFDYLKETAYFLTSIGKLLEHLKRIGIYEDALVIVVGDHGHFSGGSKNLYTSFPGAKDFKGYESGPWARAACMYNPAFLVKPPKAVGATVVSHNPASITYVRSIVDAALNQPIVSVQDIISSNLKNNPTMDIIVFGKRTQSSPYRSSKSHITLKLQANASGLAQLFSQTGSFPFTYPRYVAGTKTSLTKGNLFLEGAWIQEEKGAWIQAGTVYMTLTLENPQPAGDFLLTLGATPLVSDSHPRQRVRVYANEKELGIITYHEPGEQSIILPGSILRNTSGKLRLDFEPLDPISPKELGSWDTSIPISIFVQTMVIKNRLADGK